jgi:hypothetical protein
MKRPVFISVATLATTFLLVAAVTLLTPLQAQIIATDQPAGKLEVVATFPAPCPGVTFGFSLLQKGVGGLVL